MDNIQPDDAELEYLLTRLLRMVSPAFAAESTVLVGHPGLAPDAAGIGAAAARSEAAAAGSRAAAAPRPARSATDGVLVNPLVPDPAAGDSTVLPVSGSEARALIELVSARGIAQGELASLLRLDKSTVSRLAASLERKGWVRRGRDEGNQRYVRLYLTPEGGDVAARVWQAWQSRQARILAALSDEERAGLAAGLRGLIRGLAAEQFPGEAAASGGAGFR